MAIQGTVSTLVWMEYKKVGRMTANKREILGQTVMTLNYILRILSFSRKAISGSENFIPGVVCKKKLASKNY